MRTFKYQHHLICLSYDLLSQICLVKTGYQHEVLNGLQDEEETHPADIANYLGGGGEGRSGIIILPFKLALPLGN